MFSLVMKKIKPKILIIFVTIIIFSVSAFGLMLYSGAKLFFVEKPALIGSEKKTEKCEAHRRLDGVCIAKGEEEKYPAAVIIDNKQEAWPWSGLSYAGLVFEAPVEGGVTRFLAVYTTDKEIKKIGPVRSARPYYLDWTMEFGAILAHVGGSQAALDNIHNNKKMSSLNLDEYRWGGIYFWRAKDRIAPHNTYTSSKLLNEVRAQKKVGKPEFDKWEFKDDDFASERGDAKNIRIKFSIYPQYDAVWEYDKEKNEYRRAVLSAPAKDEDGRMILAKNIAVLKTDIEIIDAVSRRAIKTVGSGDALIFQDGKKIEGRWDKRSEDDRVYFFYPDGKDIKFNRGATWIEIVSDLTQAAEDDKK